MKVGNQEIEISLGEAVELKEGESIQLLVPASDSRTAVHLSVICGKLEICGGASIIDSINGPGMALKVKM
jgi:hypothetical protein